MTTSGPTPPDYLHDAAWFKSSASGSNGGCLEAAFLPDGRVAIRDSEDPANPPFVITRHAWTCWIDGAKNGEFDPPRTAQVRSYRNAGESG